MLCGTVSQTFAFLTSIMTTDFSDRQSDSTKVGAGAGSAPAPETSETVLQADSEMPVLRSLCVQPTTCPTTSLQDTTPLTSLTACHASSRSSSTVAIDYIP